MLHHLEHRHHQEDDIDLSKQTRITVYRLHLNRRPVSVVTVTAGKKADWKKKKKKTKKTHALKPLSA